MLPIFFATYGAVFIAEIVGDKLLYTTGVLATRYRTIPILMGMAASMVSPTPAGGGKGVGSLFFLASILPAPA